MSSAASWQRVETPGEDRSTLRGKVEKKGEMSLGLLASMVLASLLAIEGAQGTAPGCVARIPDNENVCC
jgi:hypothetical protein